MYNGVTLDVTNQLRSIDVIFRPHGWISMLTWRYFPSAMVGQKVKLHEQYFPAVYIHFRNRHAHRPCGLWSHWCIN